MMARNSNNQLTHPSRLLTMRNLGGFSYKPKADAVRTGDSRLADAASRQQHISCKRQIQRKHCKPPCAAIFIYGDRSHKRPQATGNPQDMGKRITGRTLQRIRKRVLSDQPLCVECLKNNIARAAVEVDHIDPLFKGGEENPHDDSNRQGLCVECHKEKTAKDKGYTRRSKFDSKGRVIW